MLGEIAGGFEGYVNVNESCYPQGSWALSVSSASLFLRDQILFPIGRRSWVLHPLIVFVCMRVDTGKARAFQDTHTHRNTHRNTHPHKFSLRYVNMQKHIAPDMCTVCMFVHLNSGVLVYVGVQ